MYAKKYCKSFLRNKEFSLESHLKTNKTSNEENQRIFLKCKFGTTSVKTC